MDATTSPSPDARIARFSRAERWVHRSITALMIVLIATAAALYFPDISVLVGNRPIVSNIHVIAGFVLPIPLILALASRAFRQDAELLEPFHRAGLEVASLARSPIGPDPGGQIQCRSKTQRGVLRGLDHHHARHRRHHVFQFMVSTTFAPALRSCTTG